MAASRQARMRSAMIIGASMISGEDGQDHRLEEAQRRQDRLGEAVLGGQLQPVVEAGFTRGCDLAHAASQISTS